MTEDYLQRFSGIARLYGLGALERFHEAHVCVVGVGGVGSWIVEALARSGVGALTLVDLDDVCITNINRQLPALSSVVGQPKTKVLAARVHEINPGCRVTEVPAFVSEANVDELLSTSVDVVVDAVDRMSIKAAIIAWAVRSRIPVFTCGSAGVRTDPSFIKTADLGIAGHDLLFQQVRRKLRKDYGFPHGQDGKPCLMGVTGIWSMEKPVYPGPDGTCSTEKPAGLETGARLDCAAGYGAATHVTGSFAFAAAAAVLKALAGARRTAG